MKFINVVINLLFIGFLSYPQLKLDFSVSKTLLLLICALFPMLKSAFCGVKLGISKIA